MAIRRKYDIVIIIALVLGGLAFACFRPEFRLQSSVPPEFFDATQVSPSKRAAEEKIAAAYWNCAVTQVQWKYGYASRVPDAPPPEFGVSVNEVGSIAKDEAVRRHYWAQLRSTWHVSSAWKTEYAWSSVSFRQSLRAAGDSWGQVTQNFFGK
jgi:hypothetical protein